MNQNEGILGLGLGEIDEDKNVTSTIGSILAQAGLKQHFSFFPGRNGLSPLLTLGGYHSAYIEPTDSLNSVPILPEPSRKGLWKFSLPALSFVGKRALTSTAVLDSRTSMILLPKRDRAFVKFIRELVLANGFFYGCRPRGYDVVCGGVPSLAALRLTIMSTDNKYELRLLSPSDFFIDMEDDGGKFCVLGIDTADVEDVVLGTVFMKRHYTLFDVETKSVQFYDLGPKTKTSSDTRWYIRYLLVSCAALMALVAVAIVRGARYFARRRLLRNAYGPVRTSSEKPFEHTLMSMFCLHM